MTINEFDLSRFTEKLPFFVSGTLNSEEQRWMHLTLASNPGLYEHLIWQHTVMQQIVQQETEAQQQAPQDLGWATLESRLGLGVKNRSVPKALKTMSNGFALWWNRAIESVSLPVAVGSTAASVLVVCVGSLLVLNHVRKLEQDVEFAQYRGCGVQEEDQQYAFFRIGFKPGTTEKEIRFALIKSGMTIVIGPTQLGEYLVRTPRSESVDAKTRLDSMNVLESIAPVQYPH